MSLIRVLLSNLIVLFFLLMVSEFGVRVVWTFKSCYSSACDFSFLKNLKVRDIQIGPDFGLSEFHSQLGYVPRANFSAIVNAPGWNSVNVNIDERGFRKNDLLMLGMTPKILAVGDSFTFGYQVSDMHTWPACLQKKMGLSVINAGVFGYGAAQALKRAKYELSLNPYDLVIFSILVEDDFDRDRLEYNNGFPRPALIKENSNMIWAPVPDFNRKGTKYSPASPSIFSTLYINSLLFAAISDRVFPFYDHSGSNLSSVHSKAAEVEEIIEWTLTEFSKLSNVKKVLVLQYSADLISKKMLMRRDSALRLSKTLDLEIVDTYQALKTYDSKLLWSGHHTPMGNEVVCNLIKEALLKKPRDPVPVSLPLGN